MKNGVFVCGMLGVGIALLGMAVAPSGEKFGFRYVAISARVVDEEGTPVSGASVSLWTEDISDRGVHERFELVSDADGYVTAKGRAQVGIGYEADKEGYYQSRKRTMIAFAKLPKGERIPVNLTIRLKRVLNPIPMHVQFVTVKNSGINWDFQNKCFMYTNTISGYDLVVGDYLPPLGNGRIADLSFHWELTNIQIPPGESCSPSCRYDTRFEIALTNCVDGIMKGTYESTDEGESVSELRSDYSAPESGYERNVTYWTSHDNQGKRITNDDGTKLYYFRIRTETNLVGNVTNALYGKIYFHGSYRRQFQCYLNTTINDRNVESTRRKDLNNIP